MKYNIIYLTLGGGKFLGQIVTSGLEKLGKEYFDTYDRDGSDWMSREDIFHYNENVAIRGTHRLSFDEIANLENLIFISASDDASKNRISERNTYISTAMKDDMVMDLRMKYHDECLNYLNINKINYFELKHIDLWRYETFLRSMEALEKNFDISFDRDVLQYAHKKWIKSNIRQRGIK